MSLSKSEIEDFKRMMENTETKILSPEEFDRLQAALSEPAAPSPKLVELMNREKHYTFRSK